MSRGAEQRLVELVRKTLADIDTGLSKEEAVYRLRHFMREERTQ